MNLILCLFIMFKIIVGNVNLLVKTQQGSLVGTALNNKVTGEIFYGFLNIPYAEKPVGKKRFRDPEEPLPWDGVRNAKEEGNACLSMNVLFGTVDGDEDCLNLNVYTSKSPSEVGESLKPVMVWIHGGAFHFGSNSANFYGPDFLMMEDIVLVTINYRLNVFGFLSTQNEDVPGNAGLKDQVLALKWLQKNIAFFGGDPRNVTIFGCSAGSASVHYLILSPSAKGLFHKAIMQSGTALSPWASTKYTLEAAFALGYVFNCLDENVMEVIKCLREVDARDLVKYQYNVAAQNKLRLRNIVLFLPCIEPKNVRNSFLSEEPRKLLQSGKFHDVPFIIGTTKLETLFLEKGMDLPKALINAIYTVLEKYPELLLFLKLDKIPLSSQKAVGEKIKTFYFKDLPISDNTIINLVNLTTDLYFLLGVQEAIFYQLMQGKSQVFQYYFTLDTDYGPTKKFLGSSIKGPAHEDDLGYLFYINLFPPNIDPERGEFKSMKKIVKLWTNFAKFGNPTPDTALGIEWKAVTLEEKHYLKIDEQLTLEKDIEKERIQFWDDLRASENLSEL